MDSPIIPIRRKRYVYPKITVLVTEAGKYIDSQEFKLDRNTESVEGVYLTTDNEEEIFNLQQRLEINQNEILPQNFEARLLYTYASVGTNDRIWDLNSEPAGNQNVKITCFDASTTAFAPYKVKYTFKCLLKD